MSINDTDIQSLLHKQAIHEVLMRFCRGIDRCDLDLIKSTFWEECVVDYGKVGGAAWEFFATVLTAREEMHVTHHQMGNFLIELEENTAHVESYLTTYHYAKEDDRDMDLIVGGRYIDKFEQRKSEWRIIKRIFVMDWNQNIPGTARWAEGLHAQFSHRGAHHPNDMLYIQSKKNKSGTS